VPASELTPATKRQPIDSYAALALQVNCRAVNALQDPAAVRAQMLANIEHIRRLLLGSSGFMRSFNGLPPRLAVLPEYFLTGFPMQESIAEWREKACIKSDGPEYTALGQLASQTNLYLSGNVYELDEHFPELYFQTSFIIAPNGEILLRYRRLLSMFAPTPHDVLDKYLDIYGQDSLFPVADTEIGRLACVASEEILYPEISRALALKGAEVLCHSSSEVGSPRQTPKNVAKLARAYENMAYVVSANSAGISGIAFPASSTDGHSQVVDYRGYVLGEAGPGESMCGNGELHIDALRKARSRPSMTNMLARQRLELFATVYGGDSLYPANNMLAGDKIDRAKVNRVIAPERSHFMDTLAASIDRLKERGII